MPLGQMIATAAGKIMGDMQAAENDQRQHEMQARLQEMQIQGNKELTAYNREQQMQMWKDTNYAAQVEQMKKAGLSVGMMYGGSGGGGATSNVNTGSVTGGMAASHGGEQMKMMEIGLQAMQLELLGAQKENIEASTEKTKAEAAKTSGIDTEVGKQNIVESKTRIDNLIKDTKNKEAQNSLINTQTALNNIELAFNEKTFEDRQDRINYETRSANQNLKQAATQTFISGSTMDDTIKEIKARAIGATIQNAVMRAQEKNIKADTNLKGAQQNLVGAQTATQWSVKSLTDAQQWQIDHLATMDWERLSRQDQELAIKKALQEWNTNFEKWDAETNIQIMNSLSGIMGASRDKTTNVKKVTYNDNRKGDTD